MKLAHKVNHGWAPAASPHRPDPTSTRYQVEVDTATRRLERRHRKAKERLAHAERQLSAAPAPGKRSKRARRERRLLEERVHVRRLELERLRRLLNASPASAEHRGRRSYRPVPPTVTESDL